MVLWLRQEGYNAFGIDVDSEPISNSNSMALYNEKGHQNSALRVLSPNGKTDFPDNYFYFSFSNQVFEHISNLERAAKEIERIT
jgi:hypothetical protein